MKNLLIIAAAVVSLAVPTMAQELPPIGETNMSHKYELVGIIDGCRVWKIDFWGKDVFITRCPGEGEAISNTQWKNNCGKGCVREMIITAENKD